MAQPSGDSRIRTRSLWLDQVADDLTPRPRLPGDLAADVAIVGAGFTGLWTAYELARREPSLRIVVLEAEVAGFGASGRNGGWCSALFATSPDAMAATHGREAVVAVRRAMQDTVDEVGRVLAREGIDASYAKGGTLTLAMGPAQVGRVRGLVDEEQRWDPAVGDHQWLGAAETRALVRVPGALGAMYTPHCARVQPAALVRGLARAAERLGVTIHEHTRVRDVQPGRVVTEAGSVLADVVVLATEGYTVELPGRRRDLLPIYSYMVATEPLPAAVWDELGWSRGETIADGRHMIIYAQRTADDRIAFGGRAAPYHFGSHVRDAYDRDARAHDLIADALRALFPAAADAAITHRWGGPLGVPRDWSSSVTFDRSTGLARAGGYVGDGVATANLAGRTLADLVLGEDTELTRLPWVGHRSPRWEPEPFRWLGVRAMAALPAAADRREASTGRPDRVRAAILRRVLGH